MNNTTTPFLVFRSAMNAYHYRMDGASLELSHPDWNRLRAETSPAYVMPNGSLTIAGIEVHGPKPSDSEYGELRSMLVKTSVHLMAAISLLEHRGKMGAPSDAMFDMMLQDYKETVKRARSFLAARPVSNVTGKRL